MGSSEDLYRDIALDDVEYDIAVNKNEVEGEKVLLNAAIQGDYNKMEQLLKSGIGVDAKEFNKLLFYASKNYFTPLQLASLHGHDKCAQLLIEHGADVNAKDLFGLTPLHLAACSGASNIVNILLKARAACSLPLKFPYCVPLKSSAFTGSNKIPYLDGSTPLHVAASTNNVDCVKELIRYGADFNAVDVQGRTSLYVAAQYGYSECVLVHLKEAVGRDILSLPSLKTSDTPLHFAVKYQMIDCVKELLYLGSDVNHRNFEGLSPLHTALLPFNSNMPDSMTILKLLVLEGHKTDINQPDWEGFTPLHYACFYGNRNKWHRRPEMATFLMSYGANVDIEDCKNRKLLIHELKGHPEEDFAILRYMVKSLLHLPRLKSLGITLSVESNLIDETQQDNTINYTEPEWALIQRTLGGEPEEYLLDYEIVERNRRFGHGNQGRVRPYPHAGSHAMQDMVNMHDEGINLNEDMDIMEDTTNDAESLILKKQLWYEEIASRPRTLQHQCRFLIRKILGPMKIKHINKLPLPPKLHSYLLFEIVE